MEHTVTGSTRRAGSRRPLVALALAVVLAAVLTAAYFLGYRLNLQTGSIPVPTAATSPEDVVHAYVEAYNHRDVATMEAIDASRPSAFSRYRAMGTMRDLQITESRAAADSDLVGTSYKPGLSYYRVTVTVVYSGLTGSDFSFDDGPNGWTYWLARGSASEPWTIIDQGNP